MPREIISQNFQLRKAEENVDAAAVAQVFKQAKAEGKQIWYFTTPKSVPIEVIQKHAISLDKVHAGKPIFAHDGAEYTGSFEEPVSHAIKVLIPGKAGSTYETRMYRLCSTLVFLADSRIVNQSVDRVMHITRVTRLGGDGEAQPASTEPSAAVVTKAPRPQPKGLKARYQAFGVPNGGKGKPGTNAPLDDDEDVEMTSAPPLLTSAADAKADSPQKAAKKRKHGDVEKGSTGQDGAASTPSKKSKKPRVEDSSNKAAEASPAKTVHQTPIAPPPVPALGSAKPVQVELSQSTSTKRSKNKDKSRKKDSASLEKASDSKKPAKVTPVLPPAVPGVKTP